MTDQDADNDRSWGKENPRRGVGNEDLASSFVKDNPIGSTLTPDEFDEWAQRHGLLNVPTGAPKQSDAWKAHLHRRHELKRAISRASTTTKINTPFLIETVSGGNGLWEVRSPEKAIALSKVGERVESLVKTKRKQLAYLMQSADWTQLPPYERVFAESLYDDIDSYAANTNQQGEQLDHKFARLRLRLDSLVKKGEVKPENGGIKAITDESDINEE